MNIFLILARERKKHFPKSRIPNKMINLNFIVSRRLYWPIKNLFPQSHQNLAFLCPRILVHIIFRNLRGRKKKHFSVSETCVCIKIPGCSVSPTFFFFFFSIIPWIIFSTFIYLQLPWKCKFFSREFFHTWRVIIIWRWAKKKKNHVFIFVASLIYKLRLFSTQTADFSIEKCHYRTRILSAVARRQNKPRYESSK